MSYEKVHVDRTIRVTRYQNVRCDNCEAFLKKALYSRISSPDEWENLQAEDALEISFSGGYGMYIDPFFSQEPLLFCKTCADKLCEHFPSIKKALEH